MSYDVALTICALAVCAGFLVAIVNLAESVRQAKAAAEYAKCECSRISDVEWAHWHEFNAVCGHLGLGLKSEPAKIVVVKKK